VDMEKSNNMSQIKQNGITFTNEETIRKRAWIEKALDGVRGRFVGAEDILESNDRPSRPNLYVVDSKQSR
jgi:hypothetical protein